MRTPITDLNKIEKVCRGFPLLDDQDKMFILGVAEGLGFAKEKPDGTETDPVQREEREAVFH